MKNSLKNTVYCLTGLVRRLYKKASRQALTSSLSAPGSCQISVQGRIENGPFCEVGESAVLTVGHTGVLRLGESVYLGRNVEIGTEAHIEIGDHTSIQDRCHILGEVEIGSDCIFAPQIFMSSGTHVFDESPSRLIRVQDQTAGTESAKHQKILIGDDCWIGFNVFISRGVTIGRGCVIGANSVVTQNLPPYSVAVGAPARVIKKRWDYQPKNEISGLAESDFPYFYSGFSQGPKELGLSQKRGGLFAKPRFQLHLADSPSSPSMKIRLSCLKPVELTHQESGQTYALGEGSQEVVVTHPRGLASFVLSGGSLDQNVVIQGASR